jgi:pyridoxal 5''-phosphate synthase, glutaminase subunit Pdx2
VIGVLALQGNFDSHIKILKKINLKHKLIKTSDDLSSVDGLIIPGGESTTITNLLRGNQKLVDGINQLSKNKPILGSCAGLILMSKESKDSRIHNFGFLDVITSRNAYGRQVHSFEAKINVKQKLNEVVDIEVLFIRAPKIDKINKDVEILATFQEEVVAVRQGMHIGISCHPELLNETLIHEICFKGKHEISR